MSNPRPLTYLACPYSSPSPEIRWARYDEATAAAAWLIDQMHWNAFSPITHSHPLHMAGLRGDWHYWLKIDTEFLSVSCRLVVLCVPGWEESTGVQAEIKIARETSTPVYYLVKLDTGKYFLAHSPPSGMPTQEPLLALASDDQDGEFDGEPM